MSIFTLWILSGVAGYVFNWEEWSHEIVYHTPRYLFKSIVQIVCGPLSFIILLIGVDRVDKYLEELKRRE